MAKPQGWDARRGWKRPHRFAIMLSDEELEALDNWRFENRAATRAEAARQLIDIGLSVPRQPSET